MIITWSCGFGVGQHLIFVLKSNPLIGWYCPVNIKNFWIVLTLYIVCQLIDSDYSVDGISNIVSLIFWEVRTRLFHVVINVFWFSIDVHLPCNRCASTIV
jgi:hypothetical protein